MVKTEEPQKEQKDTGPDPQEVETEEEALRRKRREFQEANEKDEIIFSAATTLFRYKKEEKCWTVRGKGKIRVSVEPTLKKYRILHVREKIYKLGCNHFIDKTTDLTKYSLAENSWLWTSFGDNCGDNQGSVQKYIAKFSCEEDSNAFKAAVEKGRAENMKKSQAPQKEKEEPEEEEKEKEKEKNSPTE